MAIAYLPSEQSDAKKTGECIEEAGQKAVLLPGDLTDEAYARQLVHDVHKQLGGLDIVVNNAVAPGPIWTPLQPSYGQSLEKLVQFDNDAPLGRPGQPAELAGAYVFLASDEASYVSGEVIGVPGGKLR